MTTVNVNCARQVCDNMQAVYFNLSTRKMYCKECAILINKANHLEAHRLYGQDLCTRVVPKEANDENKDNNRV